MTQPSSQAPWRKDAETFFKALDGYDQVNGLYTKAVLKVSFCELYAYANNQQHEATPALKKALSSDLRTRRDLNLLLRKHAIAFMERAAAASSGDIEKREGDGFNLTLKPSKANPDQIYLIIEAFEREEIPTLLFIESDEVGVLRLKIDDYYDGEAQILLSSQDDVVKALRNHASEVILR